MDRRRGHRQPLGIRVASAGLFAALVLWGCQAAPERLLLPVAAGAVVELGGEAAAARLRNGRVEVLVAAPGAAAVSLITSSPAVAAGTVALLSYGGETDQAWNTFVYGNAPPGVARVELTLSGATGGRVVEGAWLVVLPDRDVVPDQLHWRFLGPGGEIVQQGDGIRTGS